MSTTATDGAEAVQDAGGLTAFVQEYGVGGILWALIVGATDLIGSAFGLLQSPFDATATGLTDLIGVVFADPIVTSGIDTAVESFTSGLAAQLGPFAFPAAVLTVMLGIAVLFWLGGAIAFGPFALLGGD